MEQAAQLSGIGSELTGGKCRKNNSAFWINRCKTILFRVRTKQND